uniref:Uncharacterized protein n=1 Tax=Anopheles epiroticus TaxID=199890 RepID=A0A182PPV7_9DIPT
MEDTTAEEKAQMEHQNHHNLQRWSREKSSIDSARGSPTKTNDCPTALVPATPRIDISRASSHSSHHDSRDSSPENVFEQVNSGSRHRWMSNGIPRDVGTGTLQDSGVLGFREEDTLDLRNSTEELQFMEPEKGIREKEKPNTQLEEQSSQQQYQYPQQQQHNRKDSASSEVVAFLSISGRTSRLSSVGSQGSANSKLSATSAVSGISRSPSPHKMLLETSFCGAKPLQAYAESGIVGSSLEPSTEKMLEQVILSRKKDPTEAVLAEGVHVLSSAVENGSTLDDGVRRGGPESFPQQPPPGGGDTQYSTGVQQGNTAGHARRKSDCGMSTTNNLEIQNIKTNQTSRSVGNKRHIPPRDLKNSIVGVMPSGTEYIRIKLKPDHCYSDNGIADNERVVEKLKDSVQELSVPSAHDQHRTRASSVTRSPSPANVSVSRKNSFCSLLKFKDGIFTDKPNNPLQQQQHLSRKKRTSTASNESGTVGGQTDYPNASTNSTPSKQKLVLKMFKSKRDSKSKSPSPMGSAADGIGQPFSNSANSEQYTTSNISAARSPGSTGLRYYDAPLDGQSIHIPLHTPPEERRLGSFRSATGVTSSSFVDSAPSAAGGAFERQVSISASGTPTGHSSILKHAKTPKQQRIANMTVTIHDRPKPMPPLKCYRIDNPDGSIIIPLKSPIEDKENSSHNWENVIGELSQRIEKHVSEEREDDEKGSKSFPAPYNEIEPAHPKQDKGRIDHSMPPPPPPPPPPASRAKAPKSSVPATVDIELHRMQQVHQITTATSVSASMRKKQAALFQMRMGSGSEEQIFSTTLKDYTKEMHRNSSTVSQSSETSLQKAQFESIDGGDRNNVLVGECTVGSGGDTQTRKSLAGNCSEHPSDLQTGDRVTSTSSPQQVMQAQGAMLMKELHEHHKQHQLRQQQKKQEQEQQQPEKGQMRDSYSSQSKSTEATNEDATPVVSRSSSQADCISSDNKHHPPHQHHQHQNHQHQLHNHVHRQKHHNLDHNSSVERPGSSATADDGMASSESEKDSEFDSASIRAGRHALRPNMLAIEDHESAGLVFQESFDDELPYIPTTLPEEKPVGIKLVPVKERTHIDLKTYPLERPRSTTPIHPGSLDKYCNDRSGSAGGRSMAARASAGGDKQATLRDSTPNSSNVAKLRISLPVKKNSDGTGSGGASRVFEHRSSLGAITMTTTTAGGNAGGTTNATGIGSTGRQYRSTSTTTAMMSSMVISNRGIGSEDSPTPPPLPPRKASTSASSATATATPPGHKWIDVEAIPELRKAPKRITAIPQKPQQQSSQTRNASENASGYTPIDRRETGPDGQVYNYVNPEDCQCECHEHERTVVNPSTSAGEQDDMMVSSLELADDCRPLLRSSSSSLTTAPMGTTSMVDECCTDQKVRPEGVTPDNEG